MPADRRGGGDVRRQQLAGEVVLEDGVSPAHLRQLRATLSFALVAGAGGLKAPAGEADQRG